MVLALLAHAVTEDVQSATSSAPSAGLQAALASGLRFGLATANAAPLQARASWANQLQEKCEASRLGIPFVLSSEPVHAIGAGTEHAEGFTRWPQPLGLAASGDPAVLEGFGQEVAKEYRAIGLAMALGVPADLATEPRWRGVPFTLGDDAAKVAALSAAYVKGLQGAAPGKASVAAVASHFPGAGPAQGGWDARLAKGKLVTYPGHALDAHLAAFRGAIDAGVAGVMPGYAISQRGPFTALGGLLDASVLEQVGASFNGALLTGVLRERYGFGGLVLAPQGVLEDAGTSPLGGPWGVESLTRLQRLGKAVGAGVDQFVGVDLATLAAARDAGLLTGAQLDAAARRALRVMFRLGLFEDPYVDPAQAQAVSGSFDAFLASHEAQTRSLVLLVNALKPPGWLDGDPHFNAGNGSGRVLPAPPGQDYVAGRRPTRFFLGGAGPGGFDLDAFSYYSFGYGVLTNDVTDLDGAPLATPAARMAASDYVLIRLGAPATIDPDSGPLGYCKASLEYTSAENAAVNAALLQPIRDARAAIDAKPGSQAQLIVFVDGGRPSVVSELLALGISGLYLSWGADGLALVSVAFGTVNGTGTLPVGLPRSDAAAAAQKEDVAGDGVDELFVEGFGLQTRGFLR